jgi:hypothetical protein
MRRLLLPLLCSAALAAPEGDAKGKKPPVVTRGEEPARAAQSIANLLRSRRLTCKLEKVTLDEFVDYVRAATGINIFVHKGRLAKDGVAADAIEIDLDVKDVACGDVLKLAFAGVDLGFRIQGNVLVITSKKDARGKPVLRVYSVAHLLVPIRDFPGPDMNIYPSNFEPPEPPEPEVVQTYDSSEQLAELIRTFTGEGTWEDEDVRITVFRHHLFIRTYPGVHAEIDRLLAELPR